MGIRLKLLLASLSLLVVPWLGYHYIQSLESYLRDEHEAKLIDRASIMATVIAGQKQLLDPQPSTLPTNTRHSHLYIRPLQTSIQLDGYLDDWRRYQNRVQPLGSSSGDLQVTHRIGHYKGFLYIALQVMDDTVVYRAPKSRRLDRADHIRISMQDSSGVFRRYQISAISPGRVNTYLAPSKLTNSGKLTFKPEPRIKGGWQFTHGGYTVELQVPLSMLGGRLAIAVADVDDAATGEIKNIVANANTENANELGTMIIPSAQMTSLLERLKKPHHRLWVIDTHQRVIGMAGDLNISTIDASHDHKNEAASSPFSVMIKLFYHLALTQPSDHIPDRLSSASRLENPAITSALSGAASAYWQPTGNEDINVTIAAHPIYVGDNIVGAFAIEENSNRILLLQNRVIEAVANMTIITFLLTVGILLIFATRLSLRIHKLRNDVDATISKDGKIQPIKIDNHSSDEIGDLGRSFSRMLKRLSQYNRYLETMSGKLSHELRTPITIVRSSLDNIDQATLSPENATYIQRANEGTLRLNNILTRMSEATHLEQIIHHELREVYYAATVIESCINGYRIAYPNQRFNFNCSETSKLITVEGAPELLAQLLDKLIDNATDFAPEKTTITITIEHTKDNLTITVHNQGSSLPSEMRESLFDSMVSLRQHKTNTPHLGLGLYIVRLITEFHRAKIEIINTTAPEGVGFKLSIPITQSAG